MDRKYAYGELLAVIGTLESTAQGIREQSSVFNNMNEDEKVFTENEALKKMSKHFMHILEERSEQSNFDISKGIHHPNSK